MLTIVVVCSAKHRYDSVLCLSDGAPQEIDRYAGSDDCGGSQVGKEGESAGTERKVGKQDRVEKYAPATPPASRAERSAVSQM